MKLKMILEKYPNKILLPIDAICSTSLESNESRHCFITDLK